MPLRWEILHEQKLVHIVAEGAVTLKDLEEHFDNLVVADALGYGKLFDASRADPLYSDDVAPSKRPARLFKTEAEARLWLFKVADEVADQRTQPG